MKILSDAADLPKSIENENVVVRLKITSEIPVLKVRRVFILCVWRLPLGHCIIRTLGNK